MVYSAIAALSVSIQKSFYSRVTEWDQLALVGHGLVSVNKGLFMICSVTGIWSSSISEIVSRLLVFLKIILIYFLSSVIVVLDYYFV